MDAFAELYLAHRVSCCKNVGPREIHWSERSRRWIVVKCIIKYCSEPNPLVYPTADNLKVVDEKT